VNQEQLALNRDENGEDMIFYHIFLGVMIHRYPFTILMVAIAALLLLVLFASVTAQHVAYRVVDLAPGFNSSQVRGHSSASFARLSFFFFIITPQVVYAGTFPVVSTPDARLFFTLFEVTHCFEKNP
jgi:hypothetical protein